MEGDATTVSSTEPVQRLIALPPPSFDRWDAYRDIGITDQHVPELIAILKDESRPGPDWSDEDRYWPLVHAWRALGELQSADPNAVAALLDVAQRLQSMPGGDDWSQDELPKVFGMIGPDTIDPLATFLADRTKNGWARDIAAAGIRDIARRHPAHRERCIAILAAELEKFVVELEKFVADDDSGTPDAADTVGATEDEDDHYDDDYDDDFDGGGLDLPSMLVSHLLDLKAVEAVPQIKRAYHAGRIDESLVGHWGDVLRELDLPAADDDPPWQSRPHLLLGRGMELFEQHRRKQVKEKEKAKLKRKQARKARKQNRRRR